MFDVVNPLQYTGQDAVRKRTDEWLSSFRDPLDYDIRDLNIAAGDDVAFCHSLNRVNGTTTDGNKIDMWWRATLCFRKIDGKWMVTHEHSSVPFDPKTGRASLDLKP
jgi:ketosteroid isomerase-like protein